MILKNKLILLLLLQLFFCYSDATTTVDIGVTAAYVGDIAVVVKADVDVEDTLLMPLSVISVEVVTLVIDFVASRVVAAVSVATFC